MNKKSFWFGVLAGVGGVLMTASLVFGVIFGVNIAENIFSGYGYYQEASGENYGIIDNDDEEGDYDYDDGEADQDGDDEIDEAADEDDALELMNEKLNLIEQQIDSYYIFDYDKEDLYEGILKGYVEALGDEYSEYYTAEEYAFETDEDDGSICGIGATVSKDKDTGAKTITAINSTGPASKAGMKVGDVLTKVDGESIADLTITETVKLIRGEKGTEVTITVNRDGKEIDFKITRAEISVTRVTYKMLAGNVGYIKLEQFDATAEEQMKEALEALDKQGMKSLVLDLRDNPGGGVNAVVNIADMFLDKGLEVAKFKMKDGTETSYSTGSSAFCTVPMSILVNGNSASGAELLSGALQCHNRATIVGTQTFGKGIAQNTFPMQDSSGNIVGAVKLTTAYYYLPNGECVHKKGVTPDVVVEAGDDENSDPQLTEAIKQAK